MLFLVVCLSLVAEQDRSVVESNPGAAEEDDDGDGQGGQLDATYQCLKWQPHNAELWHGLVSATYQEL